jgi:hypothetical protein
MIANVRAQKIEEREKSAKNLGAQKIKERGSAKARNLRPKKEREELRKRARKRKREA